MTDQTPRPPERKPASHQSPMEGDRLLHSGNAGFIIARSAQLSYEHRANGRRLFADVIRYMNQADLNSASFFFYEEAFGNQDRIHWLIHWKQPNDFQLSLEMVDHDEKMIDLLESDRVVDDDGAGAWGRSVVDASVTERILVPQHGLVHGEEHEDGHGDGHWVDPAYLQTSVDPSRLLNSANAGLIVHRTGQAKHELRKEARYFAFAWQNLVNERLAGTVTSYLYEETFGAMDRLHWLIHMRDFAGYQALRQLEENDKDYQALMDKQFVADAKGGGTWGRTFRDGSIQDTLLVPYQLPDQE